MRTRIRDKISKEDAAYIFQLAWYKTLGMNKEASKLKRKYKLHRIRTYLNKNKWWILGIIFLVAFALYSGLEIYLGFKLGVY